jgi:hypothetical protein
MTHHRNRLEKKGARCSQVASYIGTARQGAFEGSPAFTRTSFLRGGGTSAHRREIIAFARKAVAIGHPICSLTSLSVLLQPDLVERDVEPYWNENGEKPKIYTVDLPWWLFVIAREIQCLSADALSNLADLRSAAKGHRPTGLTEKNRAMIRAARSTKVWVHICSLPQQLITEARRRPRHPTID